MDNPEARELITRVLSEEDKKEFDFLIKILDDEWISKKDYAVHNRQIKDLLERNEIQLFAQYSKGKINSLSVMVYHKGERLNELEKSQSAS